MDAQRSFLDLSADYGLIFWNLNICITSNYQLFKLLQFYQIYDLNFQSPKWNLLMMCNYIWQEAVDDGIICSNILKKFR